MGNHSANLTDNRGSKLSIKSLIRKKDSENIHFAKIPIRNNPDGD